MAYDIPIHMTYTLPASAVDTAGTKLSVVGPLGLKGRLVSIGAVVTTATTVAASVIRVGTAGTADLYGSLTIPVGAAATVANSATISTTDSNQIAENTAVLISSDGGSTAGDADLTVTIAWY